MKVLRLTIRGGGKETSRHIFNSYKKKKTIRARENKTWKKGIIEGESTICTNVHRR